MDKIVNLQEYRTSAMEHKGFDPWHRRFGESCDQHTRLSDLSEKTLYQLALPGEGTAIAYYELIMGILDFGQATKFYYLDAPEQMKVIDIHLFLSDQVRFEMMRRLGWIDRYACENHSLLKMILEFDEIKAMAREDPPILSPFHPDYEAYKELTAGDREVFIRQRLRDALDTFQKLLGSR